MNFEETGPSALLLGNRTPSIVNDQKQNQNPERECDRVVESKYHTGVLKIGMCVARVTQARFSEIEETVPSNLVHSMKI